MECRETDHGPVGDQADQGVGREQCQADYQSLPQRLELILIHTRVHDVEEDWRHLSRSGEGVLDRGVFGKELGGEVGRRDVLVVGREGISGQTERADPHLALDVDLAVRERVASQTFQRP